MERFAVIGMGRFGSRLAKLLTDAGADVIAVDRRADLIETMRDDVARAVCMDATDEETLRNQGIDEVDTAIVGIGTNFEAAVLTTVLLKQMGVSRVITRATTAIRGQILTRIGADDIVNPESESADRWRTRLVAPRIIEHIELAEGFSLIQTAPPKTFVGKTLGEIDMRKNHHVQVIAVRRKAEDTDADGRKRHQEVVISVPTAETTIQEGDVLMLIGSDAALKPFGQ
ncbi:MAG: TrkA family potassium uptake protein [Phycisphaerae bacterium]|nr:TrkA family potassium uptake protein [Phycisphaerae bacterium]